jgi:hypothetical protein
LLPLLLNVSKIGTPVTRVGDASVPDGLVNGPAGHV